MRFRQIVQQQVTMSPRWREGGVVAPDDRRAGRLRRDDSIELDLLFGQFGSLGGAVPSVRL
jgi:hypothetical protein